MTALGMDYAEGLGFVVTCECDAAPLIGVFDFTAGLWRNEHGSIRFAASCESCDRSAMDLPDADVVRRHAAEWHRAKCSICRDFGRCLGAQATGPTRILIVCHGNLNRSAAGEVILRRMRPNSVEVRSAGVRATPGRIMAKNMREALVARGHCSAEGPFTRTISLTGELVRWADQVLIMDDSNEAKLHEQFLGELSGKTVVHLGRLLGVGKIPDPHFDPTGRKHHEVVTLLERAVDLLFPFTREKPEQTIGQKMATDPIFASGMRSLQQDLADTRRDLAGGSVLFPPEDEK
jgi:protein-tyrosine-phosphatase